MAAEIQNKYIIELQKQARKSLPWDTEEGVENFNLYKDSGGNVYDAYDLGFNHSTTQAARTLLTKIGVSW